MPKKKNKRLSEFDVLMNDLRGKHSKRMNAILVTMDDEDFAINYFKALEYAEPKLQRQEVIQEEQEFTVTIEHVYTSEE